MQGMLAWGAQVVEMKVALYSLSMSNPENAGLVPRWATADDRDYASQKGRKGERSLFARAALRRLLQHVTGFSGWRLALEGNGKPYLLDHDGLPGPSISLSHGGDWVVVATGSTERRIGVDVEPHKPRDVMSLAQASFGPAEQRMVSEGGEAAFYRLWTLREAMGKATGQGLSWAADGINHIGAGPDEGIWRMPGWCLGHREPETGYSLSFAVETFGDESIEVAFFGQRDIEP